jgi:PAS domain S-box-containing protein
MMETPAEQALEQTRDLQRCINDLVTLLAFPAMWTGRGPSEIVSTCADGLLTMLRLDMVYVRLTVDVGAPSECLRVPPGMQAQLAGAGELLAALGNEPARWPRQVTLSAGAPAVSLEIVRLGLNAQVGFVVAGSQRADFPLQTEQLLLNVAANQLVVALQEAQRRLEQQRVANELAERNNVQMQLRESEALLKKSEARLRQVIDCIPNIAWCNLTDGSNEFLNRAWGNYTGMPPEESTGWAWAQAMHPDDLPKLMTRWMGMLVSGEPGEIEGRFLRHDGVYRWFLIRAEPFLDEAGRLVRWYGTSTDIDDRKQAEEALLASEREFTQIVNTIPALVWSARPDGSGAFFSDSYLAYVGLERAALLEWGWTTVVHPEDLGTLVGAWQSIRAAGKPAEIEARLRRFDGEYRWFLFRGNPVLDESGRVTKWYGINTDIDDRKQAEARLRRSEAFLAEGQNLARIGNFSWLAGTDEMKWSEQLYRIFEFTPGTPVTLDLLQSRVHPEDGGLIQDMIEKARRATRDLEYSCRLAMPDGTIKHLQLVAHATRDPQGRLEYLGAVQDVTQRRVSEEALSKASTELSNVARVTSLGVLTAAIAHEVNQPISGIITNASTCLRMLSAQPPNIEGALETARRNIRDGKRAADVITRLRTLYTKRDVQPEPMDLNEAAREVTSLSLGELQRNGVILRHELADDLPPVKGDRIQLQQVILNLLRNGSDAMSTVEDRPRELLIGTEPDEGGRVRLSVRDAGVGLSVEAAGRVFEPFYTTKSEGMGIGLSVSRSIIEAHGGTLWAIPNDGPGVTFAFSLPRAQ